MQVTFLNPPPLGNTRNVEKVFGCTYTLYPIPNIFVLTYAGLLRRYGFVTRYIDFANLGANKMEFVEFLNRDNSTVYVIYAVFLSEQNDILAGSLIRRHSPKARIVFCGPAPTYNPEKFLFDEYSFVARGEADLTILELCKAFEKGLDPGNIAGLSYLARGKIVNNLPRPIIEDLDMLPIPDRSHIRKDLYYNPKLLGKPFTAVLTQRNCPYRCKFCVPNSLSYARELEYKRYNNKKPPVKVRTPKSVIGEMRLLEREGYRCVSIIDDVFTLNEDRCIEICRGIKRTGLSWGALARPDSITSKLALALQEANLRYIDLGVESFNQEVLNDLNKDIKVDAIYEAVRILKAYKISVKLNILLGASPLETEEDIVFNIKEAIKLKPNAVMFGIAAPFPGTQFYKQARENKWFVNGDFDPVSVQHKAIISYPNLSRDRLEKLLQWANWRFYLSPTTLIVNLEMLKYPRSIIHTIRALVRKLT
jgi:radical SAM superfamily enzyme YgiQ (UPF0313 family)